MRAARAPPLWQVVAVGEGYQAKIESLWASYGAKKAQEAALLEKSQRILASLVRRGGLCAALLVPCCAPQCCFCLCPCSAPH